MTVDVDGAGSDAMTFTDTTLAFDAAIAEVNAQLTAGAASRVGDQIVLKSDGLGAAGEIDVLETNLPFGFDAVAITPGATVADSSLASDDTVIVLGASGVNVRTNIRYGTYQFGTLRIFTSINDTEPVAYIMHPDLLSDLIIGVA